MTMVTVPPQAPLVVNGLSIYAHPIFLDQLDDLIREVEARKAGATTNWQKKNCAKRLVAILKLMTEAIPTDPGAPQFRQGNTLGDNRKHWFRAKFFQQYRLFFRFDSASRVIVLAWVNIVLAWVNDERNLRAYINKTDAYATFRKMLDGGNPTDCFDALMNEAATAAARLEGSLAAAAIRSS